MELAIPVLICFCLGGFMAYMDLSSFFKQRRLGAANMLAHWASALFLVGNGVVGLALFGWSISSDEAAINAVLPAPLDTPIGKAFLIGLAVPVLIRSKWFSVVTTNNRAAPVGLEAVYEWVRGNVLLSVHRRSLQVKNAIAHRYAERLKGKKSVPDQVKTWVLSEAKPFKSKDEMAVLEKEYERMDRQFKDAAAASKVHLEELFIWAMDRTGIGFAKRCLEQLAAA